MPRLLHILTVTGDPLPERIIAAQREDSGNQVEVADLTGDEPDYSELLDKVFEADSIAVW